MTDRMVKDIVDKFYLLNSISFAELSFEVGGKSFRYYPLSQEIDVEEGCLKMSRGFTYEYFNIRNKKEMK